MSIDNFVVVSQYDIKRKDELIEKINSLSKQIDKLPKDYWGIKYNKAHIDITLYKCREEVIWRCVINYQRWNERNKLYDDIQIPLHVCGKYNLYEKFKYIDINTKGLKIAKENASIIYNYIKSICELDELYGNVKDGIMVSTFDPKLEHPDVYELINNGLK